MYNGFSMFSTTRHVSRSTEPGFRYFSEGPLISARASVNGSEKEQRNIALIREKNACIFKDWHDRGRQFQSNFNSELTNNIELDKNWYRRMFRHLEAEKTEFNYLDTIFHSRK